MRRSESTRDSLRKDPLCKLTKLDRNVKIKGGVIKRTSSVDTIRRTTIVNDIRLTNSDPAKLLKKTISEGDCKQANIKPISYPVQIERFISNDDAEVEDFRPLICTTQIPLLSNNLFMSDEEWEKAYKSHDRRHDDDIMKHLVRSEASYKPQDYLKILTTPTPKFREVLVDYLAEQLADHEHEAFYLAINYMDRFLSLKPLKIEELQLLIITCMMIALKFDSSSDFHIDMILLPDIYVKHMLIQMETTVLSVLKFKLNYPSPHQFLVKYCMDLRASKKIYYLAEHICMLAVSKPTCYLYLPSLLSACALYIAFGLSGLNIGIFLTLKHTGHAIDSPDFIECETRILHIILLDVDRNLQWISKKFSGMGHEELFIKKRSDLALLQKQQQHSNEERK